MPRRANSAALARPLAPLSSRDPVSRLEGVGSRRAEALASLNIFTIGDLLSHFPRRHDDRRARTPISAAVEGASVAITGIVVASRLVRLRRRRSLAEVTLEDATGRIKAIWFGQGYLARAFQPGMTLFLSGEVGKFGGLALRNPDYEVCSGDSDDQLHFGRIVPVYPLTEGISQRMLRRWIDAALDAGALPDDVLPKKIARTRGFMDHRAALQAIHSPKDVDEAAHARNRFAYEELFVLQAGVLRERSRRAAPVGIAHEITGPRVAAFRASLPFALTRGQTAAIEEILSDMGTPHAMARLLQGDVGCGKTLVALVAASACVDGSHQAAFMAPTELLAAQHYRTARARLAPLGIQVVLLTGNSPVEVREASRTGRAHVVVGTHALFEDATQFQRLGLVVVDEQHRFGVHQRERLAQKGAAPDRLHMTATPIPRTLALTLYGGMDLSIIRDLPPGRRPVETHVVTPSAVDKVYAEIHAEARSGRQAYVVCPRVDTPSNSRADGVLKRFGDLTGGPLAGLRCGLVHGRLSFGEKESVLEAFRAGKLDVLVGTTILEVGVDAPDASIMVVEDAGAFGLTQLHQLRGRVGRGAHPGRCYLLAGRGTKEARARLQVICHTHDGFHIAEEDFALRGPGEVFGDRQAGLSGLRAADLLRDADLLVQARDDAKEILALDPELRDRENAALARAIARADEMRY